MAIVTTNSQNYSDIADAIRAKGVNGSFKPYEMPDAIANMPSGGITPTGKKDITDMLVNNVENYAEAQVIDINLVAENIKKDVRILGITGSFEGSGSISVPAATSCEIITIGANTVSNPIEALAFFGYTAPYKNIAIVLLDTPTIQNQFGFVVVKKGTTSSGISSTPWWRWRDNAVVWPNTFSTAWDAKLVENSKYLVIEW